MKLLRLRPATIVAALILSQSVGVGFGVSVGSGVGSGVGFAFLPPTGQSAEAFNFGKKKNADGQDTATDGDSKATKGDAATASDDKDKAGAKDSKDEAPKEKVKGQSKQDIKEEEELTAEYEAYQKDLSAALKSVKTPFGSTGEQTTKAEESEFSPMSINGSTGSAGQTGHQSLRDQLLQCKIYMPSRMMIGRPVEFTIKGRPGYWAALAMADKDKGAKPVYGHTLRLGPDRKVVALGKIPPSGVLPLKIFAPVEGDLVGGNLYFEAAVWPENNLERLELALPVSSETQAASTANSVAIIGQGEKRHGIKFVPDNRSPYSHINGPGLGSGSPI
jgi:hypothetical protein